MIKEDEPKFEWQRKQHVPREEIARNDEADKIKATEAARHLKCLKCKKWGHVNTDKACPLYGKSRLDVDNEDGPVDSQFLARGMESEGLQLKPNLLPMAQKDLERLSANIKEEKYADDIARGKRASVKVKKEEESSESEESSSDIELSLEILQQLSSKDKKYFLK